MTTSPAERDPQDLTDADVLVNLLRDDDVFGDLACAISAALTGQAASAVNGFGSHLVTVEKCYATGLSRTAVRVLKEHLARRLSARPAATTEQAEVRLARLRKGEDDLSDADVRSVRQGRCGPLRWGGPCWLMPGHEGPHHAYEQDAAALSAATTDAADTEVAFGVVLDEDGSTDQYDTETEARDWLAKWGGLHVVRITTTRLDPGTRTAHHDTGRNGEGA